MSFNVLIVDDSSSMRAVIRKIISISGFKVGRCYEAANGREALDILLENWVDVIISDINMPGVSGLDMLDHLKADDLLKDIPVIVVSTEGSDERIRSVMSKGAKRFVRKPFLPEDIRKILYEVIGVDNEGRYCDVQETPDGGDF
ncbi:MAG TPA: response regulator [Syntrophales bacterium]|nr:response regulator [Syntrophales bacterium]HRT70997.1 response regulator [Syntrophales bacterium]